MILEIDAGNSRIKWRFLRNGKNIGHGVLLTRDIDELGADVESIGVPRLIRLSTVAGSQVSLAISALSQKWGCELFSAKTTTCEAGVLCGYRDPSTMGVDRWLAMISAYHRIGGACVVVDAGSAITVDVVSDKGMHQGGYILPGLGLMRESLRLGTSDVRVASITKADVSLGLSTEEAVNHGALRMIVCLIESVAEETGAVPARVVLTGGDAGCLEPLLAVDVEVVPDLVLDGLGLVAGQ